MPTSAANQSHGDVAAGALNPIPGTRRDTPIPEIFPVDCQESIRRASVTVIIFTPIAWLRLRDVTTRCSDVPYASCSPAPPCPPLMAAFSPIAIGHPRDAAAYSAADAAAYTPRLTVRCASPSPHGARAPGLAHFRWPGRRGFPVTVAARKFAPPPVLCAAPSAHTFSF